VVLGGSGGRLDHTLANILLLAHPQLAGRTIRFVEGREAVWLSTAHAEIDGRAGDTVSLIPLGGPARIAETTGLRWALHDETLAFGPARGMSNEMTGPRATVRIHDGLLWCIHTAGPA
jgi:thiamine pyrophosphokinase